MKKISICSLWKNSGECSVKKNRKQIFWIVFIGVSYLVFNLFISYNGIQVVDYKLETDKINTPLKIVFVADLHDKAFGENNDELVHKILSQEADAVLMVGDMLNSYSKSSNKVISLIEALTPTVPVFYALGNHEIGWQRQNEQDLQKQIENAEAIVVDKSYIDVEFGTQRIRIGGLYDFAFYFGDLSDPSNDRTQIYNFLTEFQDTKTLKIMLSHRPDSFIFAEASKAWDIDLVASGHLHGGQVVLPFLGGVYGGDQGWFPEYVHGLYQKDDMNILVTSGLSTNKKLVPRWNNPPEIVVLELLPVNE